ncbi:hypothetical protein KDA_43050 [Dictyobacter alpinus]|uniref:Pyrrolo-quinoline quinone repeat domain-containing protein n=1 Tax=Dictyobacter alpinus TaxID=2014873 RepID=A0A402BBL4_9CHLR|nr:PQQ-binding-like beta-propeller repeat protein [Dictyobacter alpinus]GCE28821.1 hypothetical protein KDA_43050 [Dictyobacter alpinus]
MRSNKFYGILFIMVLFCSIFLTACGNQGPQTGSNSSVAHPATTPPLKGGQISRPTGTGTNPEPGTTSKPQPAPAGHAESIVVANGQAYVGSDNGQIYVFDASHGNIRWQHSEQATHLFAVDGDTLYAGDDAYNTFYALDASNGMVRWQRALNMGFNVVKVANGIVYVDALSGSSPSTIYALQATTGKLLWQYAVASTTPSLVAVSQGRVYDIPSRDTNSSGAPTPLTVLNATDGHVLWQLTPRAGEGTFGSGIGGGIAENNGVVYFSTTQGTVYAVQEASGTVLWHTSQPTSDAPRPVFSAAAPVFMNGVVYAGTSSAVFAYQANTGQQLWQYHTSKQGGPPLSIQPLASQGAIYFATGIPQGDLVALNASTGHVLWQHPRTGGGGGDAWLLLNGLIINQIGEVAAWRTSDGGQVWSHNSNNNAGPPGPGRNVFTDTSTGTLYVGGSDGNLQALRVSDGAQLWTYHIQEKPVQQAAIYSALVTFRNSLSYEQALQTVSDLGLKTFAVCTFSWAPEDSKDSYTKYHTLEVAANTNSAPLWLNRLQAIPEISQIQGQPVNAMRHCPLEPVGPIHRLDPKQAATYLQINFTSATPYLNAWENLNALGFRLADPCYEKERAQGKAPTWHVMGEESSFTQTHTLVLATTTFNATIWHQQLQSIVSVKQVTTLSGSTCP